MLEKLFNMLPEALKGQLVIRMGYTAASFITARVIAVLTGPTLSHAFVVAMAAANHVGIPLVIKLDGQIDQQKFQAFVVLVLMMGAEWVIKHTHANVVLPAIQASQKPEGAPPTGMV